MDESSASACVVANDSPLTGDYWDLLALPLLWLPPGPRRLMLGLGAGSVAQLLRRSITALDSSRSKLRRAS